MVLRNRSTKVEFCNSAPLLAIPCYVQANYLKPSHFLSDSKVDFSGF